MAVSESPWMRDKQEVIAMAEKFRQLWPQPMNDAAENERRRCEETPDCGEEDFSMLSSWTRPPKSADYLSHISPTREKTRVVYAPMRVMTVLPKGIKDFPDGPLSVTLLFISGVTLGEYVCPQDGKCGSLRGKLAEEFKLQPHRVRLISIEGAELLDATPVITLFPLLSTDAHDESTDCGTASIASSSKEVSSREDIQMQQERVTTPLKDSL